MAGSRPPPSPEKPAPRHAPQPLQPQQDLCVHAAPCFYPHVSGAEASRFLAEIPKAHSSPRTLQGTQFPAQALQTQTWEPPPLRAWQTQPGRGSTHPHSGLCPRPAGQRSLLGLLLDEHLCRSQASLRAPSHPSQRERQKKAA